MSAVFAGSVRPVRRRPGWRELLRLWRRRSAERRALLTLNDRELRDIGITRTDALWEARKPFWRG